MCPSRCRARFAALLAGALVCAPLAPGPRFAVAAQPPAPEASLQERLTRVRTDLFSGQDRPDEAIRELKEILAVDPRSAEGHLLLGLAYRSKGSPELMAEAKAELRQALALDPEFLPARLYLAQIYLDFGRAERARDELDTALGQHPGQPQFLALLGEAERQLGNPRRALEVTRQALDADASFAEARYYLGLALLDLGQPEEAVEELERVVASGAHTADVYRSLGTAYLDAGRLAEGLDALRHAIRRDPSRFDTRIQLARAYRLTGSLDEAEEELGRAMPEGGATLASPVYQEMELDLAREQGLVKLEQRELEAAAEAFQHVLHIDPDHGPTHRHLAEVYLLQGRHDLAVAHATRAEALGSPLGAEQQKRLRDKDNDGDGR